jgi:hypothetical protein
MPEEHAAAEEDPQTVSANPPKPATRVTTSSISLKKLMNEHKDKLTDADRDPLNKSITRLRDAIKSTDVAGIKSATEELEQASQALSKALYERTSATAQEMHQAAPIKARMTMRSMQNSK